MLLYAQVYSVGAFLHSRSCIWWHQVLLLFVNFSSAVKIFWKMVLSICWGEIPGMCRCKTWRSFLHQHLHSVKWITCCFYI